MKLEAKMLRKNDCCAESSESEQHSLHESGNLTLAENEVNLNRTSPPCMLYYLLISLSISQGREEDQISLFANSSLRRLAICIGRSNFDIPHLSQSCPRSSSPRAWTSTCSLLVRRDEVVQGNPRHHDPMQFWN